MATTLSELVNVGVEHQNELTENYDGLSPEAREVVGQLTEIKKAAVAYLSSAQFLHDHFYPEDTLGPYKIRHQIELGEDDDTDTIYAFRHATLPTPFGQDLFVSYATAMEPEEVERALRLQQWAAARGHLINSEPGRSEPYRRWKETIFKSGTGKEAIVAIGFEGVGTLFQLNGQVSRIESGESVVGDGRLLDPDMGFVDTELFNIARDVLRQKLANPF